MKKVIGIEGMSCGHCVKRVHEAISAVAGVESVDVNLAERRATVEGGEIDLAALTVAVEDAGYDVVSMQETR
jgi:Cu+-exporting ATPase